MKLNPLVAMAVKEARVTTLRFPVSIWINTTGVIKKNNGFTLIELMVVMALIALVFAAGAKRLFPTGQQLRSDVRSFATLIREVRNSARLQDRTYRLVIDRNEDEGHRYWVESAPGHVYALDADDYQELRFMTEDEREKIMEAQSFEPDTRLVRSPRNLPRGLEFQEVETPRFPEGMSINPAYVYFYPHGFSDLALIHISHSAGLHWTVLIQPLAGRARLIEGELSLAEVQQQDR